MPKRTGYHPEQRSLDTKMLLLMHRCCQHVLLTLQALALGEVVAGEDVLAGEVAAGLATGPTMEVAGVAS